VLTNIAHGACLSGVSRKRIIIGMGVVKAPLRQKPKRFAKFIEGCVVEQILFVTVWLKYFCRVLLIDSTTPNKYIFYVKEMKEGVIMNNY
jgi:hypothetical protein